MSRHVGWCDGARRQAESDGSCPRCGFKGKLTKHGIVRNHKDRRAFADRCPACPFPDDRPNCCHDGDLS